jgi:hypothetical protein
MTARASECRRFRSDFDAIVRLLPKMAIFDARTGAVDSTLAAMLQTDTDDRPDWRPALTSS